MERRATGTLALLLMLGAGAASHARAQAPAPAQVKCTDHGQLLDEPAVRIMVAKGVWWSLQPFTDDGSSVYPDRAKQQQMFSGTDRAYALAKKFRIRTTWGTDILFSPENALRQGKMLSKMVRWYTPAGALKMATADSAALLAVSGPRSPSAGKLGVVQEGALVDLLLVDGDPSRISDCSRIQPRTLL